MYKLEQYKNDFKLDIDDCPIRCEKRIYNKLLDSFSFDIPEIGKLGFKQLPIQHYHQGLKVHLTGVFFFTQILNEIETFIATYMGSEDVIVKVSNLALAPYLKHDSEVPLFRDQMNELKQINDGKAVKIEIEWKRGKN